jgi:hypothetical protein
MHLGIVQIHLKMIVMQMLNVLMFDLDVTFVHAKLVLLVMECIVMMSMSVQFQGFVIFMQLVKIQMEVMNANVKKDLLEMVLNVYQQINHKIAELAPTFVIQMLDVNQMEHASVFEVTKAMELLNVNEALSQIVLMKMKQVQAVDHILQLNHSLLLQLLIVIVQLVIVQRVTFLQLVISIQTNVFVDKVSWEMDILLVQEFGKTVLQILVCAI